jgi:glycosyltransferase involved in cell wall biosynthesis
MPDRALRFCMITTFYPPYNFGGDGILVQRLSNELARRGHLVDVIHCIDAYRLAARPPLEGYRDHPNVTVHGLTSPLGLLSPLATHQSGFPVLKAGRIQTILKKGFDVIHYHNISLVGGPKILEYGHAIKLYTMHDYWLVCPTHALFRFNRAPCPRPAYCFLCSLAYKRPPQWWRYFGVMQEAVKNVDAFIAPSLTSQRKHQQLGLNARIVHLPNFVSFMESGRSTPTLDSQPPEQPYFLFVGRLEKLKCLHTLIPLFQRYQKAQLWIAGTGSEEAPLRESTHGNANIRFLGQKCGEDLQTLYRRAVAVIYPSINFQTGLPQTNSGQGAPLVIIESFSQKTPVIVSNLGRIPALIEQTGGGLVYSSDQELLAAMDRLLSDSSLRRELGLRGYHAYRQNWTADAHLERYFALIEEIGAIRSRRVAQGDSQPSSKDTNSSNLHN